MKYIKRISAVFLAMIMIVTSLSANVMFAFANSNSTADIKVQQSWGKPGTSVEVNVEIENNPGIIGALLSVNYDDGLTLVNATTGSAFAPLAMTNPGEFKSPCNFSWDAPDIAKEDIKDGVILTLTFEISETVTPGTKLNIGVSADDDAFIDSSLTPVELNITNNEIIAINYLPGDVNNDGKVNMTDVVLLRRDITGGYNVSVNKSAEDVNADGKVNMTDVVLIRRYITGGYGVVLLPSELKHTHTMEEIKRIEATCTDAGNIAYWHCTECDKYFTDVNGVRTVTLADTIIPAKGHTEVIDPYEAPTYDKTGLTEGSHCSVCNFVIKKQEVIPKLEKNEYAITYHIANNDKYLQSLDIENPNPTVYTSEDGLVLQDLIVDGYEFKGWYTAQTGGARVNEISIGSSGNKVLYAQWNKVEYTIDFDSPDAPVPSSTYTVDRGITLTNPSWFGYTFVGWSDDGKIISSIEPGTTGNIVLHANWTSNRNKARAVDKLADPNIIEDADNGRYLFVYEIGTIENVPLSEDGGEQINSEGITITKELAMSKSVQEGTADKIAKTVAKATTETSSWTLSENWNNSTSATNEHDEQVGKTQSRTDSEGNVIAGKYYVSNSQGGSTSVSSSVGGSNSNSSKVTAGASIGINGEYSHKESDGTSVTTTTSKTKEKEFNWNLGGSYGQSNGAKLGMDFGKGLSGELSSGSNWGINGSIGGTNKTTNTKTKSKTSTHEEEDAYKISNSRNYNVGTERSSTSEGHWDTSSSSSSNWNSTSGYESSKETSKNTTISNAISEVINDKYSYTSMDSRGGANSSTSSTADTSSSSNEYASTVEYSTENITSEKKTLQFKSSATGYYRVITAGTVHVFAVVGYDIATNSYYTYTYNVLDNERHAYLDYSKDNSRFNDCENGIIPFEIPYDVHEYISVKIGRSEGLRINEQTGMITSYTGNAEYVVIPEYISVTDGLNKSKAVRVTGFNENVFKGNSKIKAVLLPKHIREIPNNAFEGCFSLETVIGMGINKIGSEAFKNCTSLKTFIIDEFVKSIGNSAFENAPELYVNAANTQAAQAAFNSGARSLIVCLSNMEDSIDNTKINIPSSTEFFGLLSDGRAYRNLSIESDARETFLSNFRLVENADTPLKLNSETVTLSRVIVEQSPGFSMILTNPNTNLKLYGNIELSSKEENTIISKNVNLSLLNNEVDGTLSLTGNWLINGDLTNEEKLSVTYNQGKLIHITEDEFNNYLTSSKITFDANGGDLENISKTVYYGQVYGEMPVPVKPNYTFDGWYTNASSGTKITADMVVTSLVNQTLYAHWIPNKFTVTYNVNGDNATVSTTSKVLSFGDALGELPVPVRNYYRFDGWYTSPNDDNTTKVDETTIFDTSENVTLYAHWTENVLSNWVKASEMPENAVAVNSKYSYTQRSYTTSGSASMSGWTKYDTKRTSWGGTQGPVYYDPNNGSRNVWSEQYVTSTTPHYNYYHRHISSTSCSPSYTQAQWDAGQVHLITLDYQLEWKGKSSESSKKDYYGYYKINGCPNIWYQQGTFITYTNNYGTRWYYQDPVYTYYYYKDENKESATIPTGDNISNVQEWVQYRVK